MNNELKQKIKQLREKQQKVGKDKKEEIEKEIQILISKDIKSRFDEQLQKWKASHKGIKRVDVVTSQDEVQSLFFRYPSREEIIVQESVARLGDGKEDLHKLAEQRAWDCYLGGDIELKEVLNDVEVYLSLSAFLLYHLIDAKKVNWVSC